MNNIIKLILFVVVFACGPFLNLIGQTNVGGGIYTNTTWTLANSPYIVVDTVVVFPGVTLTIEPGVTVKFETQTRLEIREAKLVAIGTFSDSITFTSNSLSPSPSNWIEIYLNNDSTYLFNFCKFEYSNTAIRRDIQFTTQSLMIKNSEFRFNNSGIYASPSHYAYIYLDSCVFKYNNSAIGFLSKMISMDHCIISNNQTGLDIAYSKIQNSIIDSNSTGIRFCTYDTIIACKIHDNDIGVKNNPNISSLWGNLITNNEIENNNTGIWLYIPESEIYCNKICNNHNYDLYYEVLFGGNTDVSNNYWCTLDSATIASQIFDGYDDVNLGLVQFAPIDSLQCYLLTSLNEVDDNSFNFIIYPNPAIDYLTLILPENVSFSQLNIFNVLGEIEYSTITLQSKININISNLSTGIYIIEIEMDNFASRQKFIIE